MVPKRSVEGETEMEVFQGNLTRKRKNLWGTGSESIVRWVALPKRRRTTLAFKGGLPPQGRARVFEKEKRQKKSGPTAHIL